MRKLLLALAFLFCVSLTNAKQVMQSKFDVDFYGFVKGAVQYNDGGAAAGEYDFWATSGNSDNQQMRVTAKETRFGVNIKAGENVSGKIEMDFYGQTGSGTNDVRIRHAYVNLHQGKWDFLFGQYWQLTPLIFPFTISPSAMGYNGHIWQRIPQIRVTHSFNDTFQAAFAFTRATTTLIDNPATNEGRPGFQGMFTTKYKGMQFVLSGAITRWRNPANPDQHGDTYVAAFGYSIPYDVYTLHGLIWTGENMTDFLGGPPGLIGYDGAGGPVRASGGYVSLKVKPWEKVWFAGGFGINDPLDKDVPAVAPATPVPFTAASATGIVRSVKGFANITYWAFKLVELTLEAGPIETWYKLTGNVIKKEKVMHYEFSAKFPF